MIRDRETTIGIDLGTSFVKVIAAEKRFKEDAPATVHVLAAVQKRSAGLRRGYIVDPEAALHALKEALTTAEKNVGHPARRAFLAASGIGLGALKVKSGAVAVARADGEVTDLDLKRALDAGEGNLPNFVNRKILHAVPLTTKLDGVAVMGRALGMRGNKLETETIFFTCLSQHLNDLLKTAGGAGLTVQDVMAGPLAAARAVTNEEEREVGCGVVGLGGGTVSFIVYEEGRPISLEVFPLGGAHITSDIALGLQVNLDDAEELKRRYGETNEGAPRKKLEDIVEARLSDIFELIENHLKKINRNGLLPAGVVLTGGLARLGGLTEAAKVALRLPARVGVASSRGESRLGLSAATAALKEQVTNGPEWTVALGLLLENMDEGEETSLPIFLPKNIKRFFGRLLDSLIP